MNYQHCSACARTWYFARNFCPFCGMPEPRVVSSAGRGNIHAVTLVHRAPSDEFRALVPYALALVDMAEGFRVMAHAAPGLAIGDPVQAGTLDMNGRALPYFTKATT